MKKGYKRKKFFEEGGEDGGSEEKYVIKRVGSDVFFYSDVTPDSIFSLIVCLRAAERAALLKRGRDGSVRLFIHSSGGDLHAGLSAMDHISSSSVPIETIADGFVASAATLLLLAGKERSSLPHSTILIHQLSAGMWGKYADLCDELQNSKQLMKIIKKVYVSKTSMTGKQVARLMKKELAMSSSQAMNLGVVNSVIQCV